MPADCCRPLQVAANCRTPPPVMNFPAQLLRSITGVRFSRHLFGRHVIFESLGRDIPRPTPPAAFAPPLMQASRESAGELLQRLQSCPDGLTDQEASVIRARVGLNVVEHEKPLSDGLRLWQSYKNPFNILLTVLAAVSYLTADIKAATVISAMVVLSTLLRFVQERRSSKAVQALTELVSNQASVIRRGGSGALSGTGQEAGQANSKSASLKTQDIPIRLLVPGDLVSLSAGDMIPADCRVLHATDLFVSQSAMTGESLPIEKFPDAHLPGKAPADTPLDMPNLLFMGTNVVSGSATAVVLATGNHSYFGTVAASVTATKRELTSFETGVNTVSWLLIRFALVMVPLVLLINGFTKGNWYEAFLFALSVAVGLTPELLPMIVTTTLAKGAIQLSRQ